MKTILSSQVVDIPDNGKMAISVNYKMNSVSVVLLTATFVSFCHVVV